MGVKGLKSFIEGKRNLLKDTNFSDNKIIIDGCNFYYPLYFDNFDQEHGGDYEDFENLVCRFFKALKMCSIDPYVVLDGGSDYTDKKFETLKQRAQDKIWQANALSTGGPGKVLPTLIKDIFKQVLTKLKVPFVQCIAEADWEIAALANEWNCPVLSDDSDFYIFDLKAGLLPLTHFRWDNVVVCGGSSKSIPARNYTVGNLCAGFNRMNKQLLPVFATLAGNDYVKQHDSRLSLRWAGAGSARIDGLLRWLSSFPGPEEAVYAVLSHIENRQDLASTDSALSRGIQEYQLTTGSLAKFFLKGVPLPNPGPLDVLPEWTLGPLAEGKLSSFVIDVLVLQRVMLSSPVQDFEMPSSNATSRPIRQALYGLLLCGRQGMHHVEEYDREGERLTSSRVEATLSRTGQRLHLETLNKEPHELRLQVLLGTLGVTDSTVSSIPPHLQLPVGVTCYWLKSSHPEPQLEHLWALLLGLVYGELRRQREVEPVSSRLNRMRVRRGVRGLDLGVAHAFSQWQCCLRDSLHLNQLLCLPLPEPACTWLYRGTLVHQAVSELKKGIAPESLLQGGGSYPGQLFRALRDAVLSSLDGAFIARMTRRGGGGEQRQLSVPPQPEDEMIRLMELLMYEEEEEEEDYARGERGNKAGRKMAEDGCSPVVRTRYRKKTRIPEQLRKHERLGWVY